MEYLFVPAPSLSQQQIALLEQSLAVSPAFGTGDFEELLGRIGQGDVHVYSINGSGVLAVSVAAQGDARCLQLEAFTMAGAGWTFPKFVEGLREFAKAYDCSTVETAVTDARLAMALCAVGCRLKSQIIELEA